MCEPNLIAVGEMVWAHKQQQLNGLSDLFHIVQENFMWLAMVDMQHKNKGNRALLQAYYYTTTCSMSQPHILVF